MIDTDKYEGHDNWEGTKVNMANEANKLLIADAPKLLAEVKRLREELDKVERERDKNSGALNMALEHLGYQCADHEQFCKEHYQCNVYGDDLKEASE